MPRPDAATSESIPVSDSLIEAMEPSEPSTIPLPKKEEMGSEPETVRHPPKERQAIVPETTTEGITDPTLLALYADIQNIKSGVARVTSYDDVAPTFNRLNGYGKTLEKKLAAITEEIEKAEEQKEETAPLREEQRAIREGLEELVHTRQEFHRVLPKTMEDTLTSYQADQDIIKRIREKLTKKELNETMRIHEAEMLRHRADVLEKLEIKIPGERSRRDRVLGQLYQLIRQLNPNEVKKEALIPSKAAAAEIRLQQQLEDAAKRVREVYGKDPEEIIEGEAEGYRVTKHAAAVLRGLMGKTDPLDDWEEIQAHIQQQTIKKPASEQAANPSPRRRRAA